MKLHLLLLFLIVLNLIIINIFKDLKTNTYLCIKAQKVSYFSKLKPSHLNNKCFLIKGLTNEQHWKIKNSLVNKS